MLDTIRIIRRNGRRFVTDGTRTYPLIAGGAGDDDKRDDDATDDDASDDETSDNDASDDDASDDEDLGDAGKKALQRERDAKRKAEREARRLKRENRKLRRQAVSSDDDDDDTGDKKKNDRDGRIELARERAELRAERYAIRAGVDEDRIERFLKLVDLDAALNEDGTVDYDELKELVADEVEAWPEFKKAKDDKREDPGDPERGPRKSRPRPLTERVESNLDDISKRTGIQLESSK